MEWFNPFGGEGGGGSGPSDAYTKAETNELLNQKVDKVSGKGLSTEDYTTEDKTKVGNLGTAAEYDVPVSGNAGNTEVVMGNDTRLSDARPASDVSDWAKALTKPSYGYDEITNTPTVDNAPTENSANLVKSGGVYTAIAEKQNEINSNNKLSADLVTDINTTNKFVTAAEKNKIAEVDDKYPIAWDIELTQEEYANLPDTKYNDGKNYYIIDGDEEEEGGEIEEVVFYDGFSLLNTIASGTVAPCMIAVREAGTLQTIRVNISTTGTLSVGTINKADVVVGAGIDIGKVKTHEVMTFTQTGDNTYTLVNPMEFKSNEYITLLMPSDTATFKYGNYGVNKGFYYVGSQTHVVTETASSLGVTFAGVKTVEKNSSTYKGKSLSILGDSISTYSGYIPSGNAAYYPKGDVQTVGDTWWKKLMDALGMTLNVNNSWSGSRVTTTNGDASAGCGVRAEALGESPDVIIVWLGINDFCSEVILGTYNGTTAVPATTTTFREAYAIMLNKILTKYKTSEVWVCTLPQCEKNGETGFPEVNGNGVALVAFNKAICELAEAFGVKVLDHNRCGLNYQNISIYEDDSLHPNKSGHSLIANNDIRQMDNYIRKRYV